ncbi:MAG: hypothetical protein U5K70_04390 [Halodesulfurarchaeum sp.]|nr:hypothetical protein [Halodesulfurarchaeum sp.]
MNEVEWGLANEIDEMGPTRVVAVYEQDVQLRVEQGKVAVQNFQEEWSDRYPDNENNTSFSFWVIYDRSPIDHQVIAISRWR